MLRNPDDGKPTYPTSLSSLIEAWRLAQIAGPSLLRATTCDCDSVTSRHVAGEALRAPAPKYIVSDYLGWGFDMCGS